MNDSVMILGGTGYIGSELIKQLIKRGYKNIASISLNGSKSLYDVRSFKADILNYDELNKFCTPYNVIVNCTGQVSYPINSCLMQNTIGISNIAKFVKKNNKKLIHLSSVSVYGSAYTVNEESPLNPETPYSSFKSIAEYLLQEKLDKHQLKIIRLSNVYGINSKGIFGYLYKSYISDKKLKFNNNGDLLRFFINEEDCTSSIIKIMEASNDCGIVNLVGKERYTIKQLIKKIETITKVKFEVEYENKEPYENIEKISVEKINKIINLDFNIDIEKFIKRSFIANNDKNI